MNGDFKLVMRQGPQPGQTFVPDQDSLILGRDPSSNIVIDASGVSRQHARITRYGGQIVIEDLQSANGTFVNGIRLAESHTLAHGDVISLGGVVTFIKLSRRLRPLSAVGAFLWARNSDVALLVIDSASSHGGSAQATTYDFVLFDDHLYTIYSPP